ncbi:MAG: hypothetical protein GC150_08510 [Rhizobiales bacterium]|nr:hypothetical protein [Hyphomicrobiales bacterium]
MRSPLAALLGPSRARSAALALLIAAPLSSVSDVAIAEIGDVSSLPPSARFRDAVSFEKDGWVPLLSNNTVYHCSGYGCRTRRTFTFTASDIIELAIIMAAALDEPSAEAERQAIATAVAWMEARVGRSLGTDRDIASIGLMTAGDPGQHDCVDEARNTAAYLAVLGSNGLIRHHGPGQIVNRGGLLSGAFPHYGVVMREEGSRRYWAVDSGVGGNGAKPRIEPARQWFARGNTSLPARFQ